MKCLLLLFAPLALSATDDWLAKRVPSIEYPALAASASVQGKVTVEFNLAPDGAVLSARAISGEKVLAAAAEANANKWKFKRLTPGAAKESTFVVIYEFRLEGVSRGPIGSESFFEEPNLVVVTAKKPHWEQ